MRKRKSITRVLLDGAKEHFQKYPNDETRKAYTNNYKKYIKYCRDNFDCRSKDECGKHIQEYSDYLQKQGYTASTIHAYLASVCNYHSVNMDKIKKPRRHTAEYTRGRGSYKNSNLSGDFDNPKFARIVRFQTVVGIRRAELKRLKGSDLVRDKNDLPCIQVSRGKGGKYHLQRLVCTKEDLKFIRQCFDNVAPDEYVFDRSELKNKLNLHYLRAKVAQRAYAYYVNRINAEGEAYIKELEAQVRARWDKYNVNPETGKAKYFPRNLIEGKYYLRGKNRQFAVDKGLPTEYLSLALTATSVLHLSHWRNDVTVESYMLVV